MSDDDELTRVTAALLAREPIFHKPEFGTTAEDYLTMTDGDYWEVGASGQVYDRDLVVRSLTDRGKVPGDEDWEVSDVRLRRLASDTYAITYQLDQAGRLTRRLTLWREAGDGWKVLYHQGTIIQDTLGSVLAMTGQADMEFWSSQSPISDPGGAAGLLQSLPADRDALAQIVSQLVFHYRADGDWEQNGIGSERVDEINLCYAADMFERLLELDPSLSAERPAAKRILGCCRDFSVLYTSILRQHGTACRCRIGFASYFDPGWWIDHVVVEVWDGERWRMIDPELRPTFTAGDGGPLDRLDLHPDRFMTASQAWVEARAGRLDPARVVVSPLLEIPETRGWPQLAHNLVHDIAALNRVELLLWQDWGASLVDDVLAPNVSGVLDQASAATSEAAVPAAVVRECANRELFRVPDTVVQVHPVSIEFSQVDVGRALPRNL